MALDCCNIIKVIDYGAERVGFVQDEGVAESKVPFFVLYIDRYPSV